MILPASYSNGFAPRDGQPLYPELWRGCVGAWAPCLGPTGLTLRDWSRYSSNAAFTSMTADTAWVANQGRYPLTLNGSSNYLLTTESLQHRLTGDKSCFAWIRCTSPGASYRTLISKDFTFALTVKDSILITYDWNAASDRSSGVNVATGNWTHVGWTIRAGVASGSTFYVNGHSVATFTYDTQTGSRAGTPWAATMGTGLGWITTPVAEYFNGSIDDLRLYNQVMSANQVRLLASRRGIAYELAPRRRSSSAVQFNRRRRLLLGASS